ncbi:PSP domain containing protein-like protein, partial [Dinothrombium tinctorium]
RYFDDECNFKAGVISDELREALGLESDRCPIWIYRMRVFGYPPGFLRKARISNSTISMFEGYEVCDEHKGREKEPEMYNPDMFVEYPGFNVPLPEGVIDECEILGMPPMLPHQQLTIAKKAVITPKPTPYKRFKLGPSSTPDQNVTSKTSIDSDVSTKSEMEKSDYSSDDDQVIKIENSSEDLCTTNEKPQNDSDSSSTPSNKSYCEENTPASNSSSIKLIAMGSPLPRSSQKPPLEKFAEGMGNLIYFENLPTSTGVFDKMRKTLHTVRQKLSQ